MTSLLLPQSPLKELSSPPHTDDDDAFTFINDTIADIGYGRYQTHLFWTCGIGWLADNLWIQVLAVCLKGIQAEFSLTDSLSAIATTITMIGMFLGAIGWGFVSDRYGRRIPFLYCLGLAAVFGSAAAWATSLSFFCALLFLMGLGVGGSLPTDGALFLEFIPMRQNMLVLMSLFWPVGQVFASMLGWAFIKPDGSGYKNVISVVGIITFIFVIIRSVLFSVIESPKYLLKRGNKIKAFKALRRLAKYNNSCLDLVLEELPDVSKNLAESKTSTLSSRIKPLFAPELCSTTLTVWLIWFTCSTAYSMYYAFLPRFLSDAPSFFTPQSDYVVISISGIPGSVLAMYSVDSSLGRRGTAILSTVATLFSLVTFLNVSGALIGLLCNCAASFFSNIMWGVVYSFTPESFPTNVRATGYGIASGLSKAAGIFAPLATGMLLTYGSGVPVAVSIAFFGIEASLMLLLPETRGSSAL